MKNKILIICMMLLNANVFAATYTVTNTGDNYGSDPNPGDGTGTLRQAIVDANNAGGTNTINFSISGSGPHTISLLNTLPTLNSGVTINGFSQSGSSANTVCPYSGSLNPTYKIIITSSYASPLLDLGTNNVVKGIVFKDCYSGGIVMFCC